MLNDSLRIAAVPGLLLWLVGCGGGGEGPPLAPVSGIVSLDGKPLEGATIVFSPKGAGTMSMAMSDPAGQFVLKTGSGRNGAAVGDHQISVSLSMSMGGSSKTPNTTDDGLAPPLATELGASSQAKAAPIAPRTVWMVPEKYSKPESSGLTVNVPSGGLKDYKLELKK